MCYVGKATKIFIVIVSILVITGLLLAFHWVRHGPHDHKGHTGCPAGSICSPPFYPQPFPATAAAGPPFSPPVGNNPWLGPVHA